MNDIPQLEDSESLHQYLPSVHEEGMQVRRDHIHTSKKDADDFLDDLMFQKSKHLMTELGDEHKTVRTHFTPQPS